MNRCTPFGRRKEYVDTPDGFVRADIWGISVAQLTKAMRGIGMEAKAAARQIEQYVKVIDDG